MRLLADERRAAKRALIVAAVLAAVTLVPAFVLAGTTGLMVDAIAFLVGIPLGWLLHRGRAETYRRSLVQFWKHWMDAANGSSTFAECHRKVMGRHTRNTALLAAVILFALLALEAALLWLAWTDSVVALAWIGLNGIAAGAAVMMLERTHRWFDGLGTATHEMVTSGEVGVWGTR